MERASPFDNLYESAETVRCKECRKAQKKLHLRKLLKDNEIYENFQEISEENWNSEIFTTLTHVASPICEAPLEYDLILPGSRNLESNNKMTGIEINRLGGKNGLLKQNKAKGEVTMMSHSLGLPNGAGTVKYAYRDIFYPIFSSKTIP